MQFFKSPRKILILFYGIIIAASLSIFTQLSFFIYDNIYKTIYNSDQILILRSMVAIEPINVLKFEEVIADLENKGKSCP